jgi:hypothetical protein
LARTFIFPDIFQGKGQAGVFAFDNSDFAKSTLAHNPKKAEMIETD